MAEVKVRGTLAPVVVVKATNTLLLIESAISALPDVCGNMRPLRLRFRIHLAKC
jgi:hypothetical protein